MRCGDGFSVGGVHVCADLGFCVSSRALSAPAVKSVRKTIPFMDGSYDFSAVYGRLYYDDRELTYAFDVVGDCPREVERRASELVEFLASIHESDIHDDDSPYYHFRGSTTSIESEWDESGLGVSVTATMTVYPFRIADDECEARVDVGDNVIKNEGFPARITVVPDSTMTIQIGALKQTFSGEAVADIALDRGDNTVTVTSGGGYVRWREERM